ncbi:MAG: hypothetical protein A2275_09115 [Bacteroidetes bacterium RIFOXYA12_FULL_35_11]|nr:MAG: hypothetical protein A2X01_01160 [Bacteroidetes bacterium GWF2_35_48]OFY73657.1 MAG: hypothetical protein A2275_09115 [Bacteroidetes bacterium RIFOXYA12_FULL_35_11]OFY99895.1 MAG: hypothetical protein A2491_01290 [Bacteroidetes bacterium RIFOXYC12_FULL_35_7]HBX51186.1 hypothetical protein [Bacteroidales bacterium]
MKLLFLILFFFTVLPLKVLSQFDLKEYATNKLGINKNVITGAEMIGGAYQMYNSNISYQNRIQQISNFEIKTKDPEELIRYYKNKIEEIKAEADRQREKKKQEIDAMAKKLADEIAALAKKANVSTGNALADMAVKLAFEKGGAAIAKNNADKKIKAEEEKAKIELEKFMQKNMLQIKDDLIKENTGAKEEYLVAAAESFAENDEKKYLDYLIFHDCIITEIEKNYTWQNADWIKTSCTPPPRVYSFSSFSKPSNDYMVAAKRKFKIYKEQYNHQAFLDAAKKFTEAALAENRNNPDAYAFLAFMTDDIIDKYMYISFAQYLMPDNKDLVREKKIVKFYFTKDFFNAIENNNIDFISKSYKLKFHSDLVDKNNNSAVAAAINADREEITALLLSNVPATVIKECYNYAITKDAEKTMAKLAELGYKINPESTDANGVPLLYLAVANNAYKAGNALVTQGINLETNLFFAKSKQMDAHLKTMAKIILNNAIELSSPEKTTLVLDYYPEIYLEANNDGKNFLELVVQKNQKDIFNLFVGKGMNLNSPTINGTKLMELAITNKANDVARKLIELGASLNAPVTGGGNLINLSLYFKNFELVPDLIAKQLSINEIDNQGCSPLYYAVNLKNVPTAELLVKNGAAVDFKLPSENGSLMHLAIDNYSEPIIDLLLSNKVPLDIKNKKGNTVLMHALLLNDLGTVSKILASKPNVNIANNKLWTPLHYAAWKGYKDLTAELISLGANINAQGEFGWTPLHYAVRENRLDITSLLLEKKANKTIKDNWKRAPLKIAREREFKEMKTLIITGKIPPKKA